MKSSSKASSIILISVFPRISNIEEAKSNPNNIKVKVIPTIRFLTGGRFLNVSVCAFSNARIIDIIPFEAKYIANRKPIDSNSGLLLFARSSKVSNTISPAFPGRIESICASKVGKKSSPPSGRNEKKYSEKKGRAKFPILLWVGTKGFNYEANLKFGKFLQELEIPHSKLIIKGAKHSASQVYEMRGLDLMKFHQRNFAESSSN